jgi:hypothetical protein
MKFTGRLENDLLLAARMLAACVRWLWTWGRKIRLSARGHGAEIPSCVLRPLDLWIAAMCQSWGRLGKAASVGTYSTGTTDSVGAARLEASNEQESFVNERVENSDANLAGNNEAVMRQHEGNMMLRRSSWRQAENGATTTIGAYRSFRGAGCSTGPPPCAVSPCGAPPRNFLLNHARHSSKIS